MVVQIQGFVVWRAYKDRSSGQWIGACDSLKLTALGETFEDLMDAATESMSEMFNILYADGELEDFARGQGFVIIGAPDQSVPPEDVSFSPPRSRFEVEYAYAGA